MRSADQPVTIRAPAKINLHLQVVGRRNDGYHEVRTLLQSVDLFDRLEATEPTAAPSQTEPRLELEVEPAGQVPTDERNLVIQAARALRDRTGCRKGARLRLSKSIPVGAGLGGGSTDAAATLIALDRLWELGLSRPDLLEIAAGIGSDVPFFLVGGLALGVGRGEEVYPLPDIPELPLLIAMPPESAPTAEIYQRLGKLTWDPIGFSVYGFSAGLRSGMPWSDLRNDLQPILLEGRPRISDMLEILERRFPVRAGVTGSGSALYALFGSRAEAERAATAVDDSWQIHVGRTLSRANALL